MDLNWSNRLDPRLLTIVREKLHFEKMTIVQSAAIPQMLDNKDVCVEACTGSGKSITFILPMLQMLLKKQKNDKSYGPHYTAALVIAPTRELTMQLCSVLDQFLVGEPLGEFIRCWPLVGGRNAAYDVLQYREKGANVIVSTPGRLHEVLDRSPLLAGQLKQHLELLILDEADLLLQMGFESALNKIFAYLPKQRRTGLFSATLTKRIDMLIRVGLRNPIRVEIKEKRNTNAKPVKSETQLQQDMKLNEVATTSLMSTGLQISPYLVNLFVTVPSVAYKLAYLIDFLNTHSAEKIIVFVSTCAQVNFFSQSILEFISEKVHMLTLHRKVKTKRQKIFADFQNTSTGCVLLCTDVMSRGIDIPAIDWVLNLDLPNDLQTFIHRSGRSGHAVGVQGRSLTLCLPHECQFIELCKQKGITFTSQKYDHCKLDTLKQRMLESMKSRTKENVHFYQSGIKAFVSFVRTYSSKNILSSQLFDELNVIDLANSYALLKMPHMPELSGKLKGEMMKFETSAEDLAIAKQHKKVLDAEKPSKPEEVLEREEKRKQIGKKIKKLKWQKRKDFVNQLEMDELAEDARMLKKAKRNKISEADLEKHFGLD